jgi:urea transport system permease protein
MTVSEIFNIVLMQGFAGLSLFSVLLLMGLGLAIILARWVSSIWLMASS